MFQHNYPIIEIPIIQNNNAIIHLWHITWFSIRITIESHFISNFLNVNLNLIEANNLHEKSFHLCMNTIIFHKVVNMIRKESFQVHNAWQSIISFDKKIHYTCQLHDIHISTNLFPSKIRWHKINRFYSMKAHPKFSRFPMQPARQEKYGEPWRLTSHPRPQRGHPQAWGNKVWPFAQTNHITWQSQSLQH